MVMVVKFVNVLKAGKVVYFKRVNFIAYKLNLSKAV